MDDLPVTTSEPAAGPSSSESGVREEKDLEEKRAEGGEEESFRKLCTHYSRGCSLVVSKFGSSAVKVSLNRYNIRGGSSRSIVYNQFATSVDTKGVVFQGYSCQELLFPPIYKDIQIK